MTASVSVFGQTTIAEWTPVTLTNGVGDFGASPFTASTTDSNLSVVGLTRGSGVGQTGTGAANAWGGTDFNSASAAVAITANKFATFTLTAASGYKFSISSIEKYNIRRSASGPTTGQWQYQVGSGAFTDIGSPITWGATTSNAGNEQAAIDLSGIPTLQNIAAGTTITFRIVNYGASGTGSWYINGHANATSKTLTVKGTVVTATLAAGDVNATKSNLVKNTVVSNTIIFGTKANVQVVNMNGQVVKSASVNENSTLDVSTLTKGIYFVTGNVNGKLVSQKITKK
jgi:hypothetical protein